MAASASCAMKPGTIAGGDGGLDLGKPDVPEFIKVVVSDLI